MNWEYYTGLRVVTMFNHKAIEVSNEENKNYILVPGPQAVELIGTEPSIGPHSYLVVKHREQFFLFFSLLVLVMMKTITPSFHYMGDLL